MDQKMCFPDFTVKSGNVLGVNQGGRVIAFVTLKIRIRGKGYSGSGPCKYSVGETLAPSNSPYSMPSLLPMGKSSRVRKGRSPLQGSH